ncbi:MAG: tRNA guanosine(34) transglycosylase Tgt [Chloroflexota bacterium]|nr:tRNA guanosine(34) transglycosylase Tgt [Chloroflexota bacterium]
MVVEVWSPPAAPAVSFAVHVEDPRSAARRGTLTTRSGAIETPAFMPVGTRATVRTLHPDEILATGCQILLGNTYHLMLQPGLETILRAGGLHAFMGWPGPILTDSGGFQAFSLAHQSKVTEDGVAFRSHIDGSTHSLSPERAVELQLGFGSDIVMALDHFVGLPAARSAVAASTARTERWLNRCIASFRDRDGAARGSALFGICQGGMDPDLRRDSAAMLGEADVTGCAIGGLSVGEPKPIMEEMLAAAVPALPRAKPRYLMGVGSPEDLWVGVSHGVDLFDCVLPTRLARNAALFTPNGRINIRNARFRELHEPIEAACDCATCQRFTAAYLHHLFRAGELLGLRLASVHNLRFLVRQMETMRTAIAAGTFRQAEAAFHARYRPVGSLPPPGLQSADE